MDQDTVCQLMKLNNTIGKLRQQLVNNHGCVIADCLAFTTTQTRIEHSIIKVVPNG